MRYLLPITLGSLVLLGCATDDASLPAAPDATTAAQGPDADNASEVDAAVDVDATDVGRDDDSTGDSADSALPTVLEVTSATFPCVSDMVAVRGFYLTNLLGATDDAVAIAEAGFEQPLPPGTLIQLIPQEAMIKGLPGSSPETDDWEFFLINPAGGDDAIVERGFDSISNAAGTCWGCHVGARARDGVCEQTGTCADAAVPRSVVDALVASDPRCN